MRPPLPRDVSGLPPLGPDFHAVLDTALARLDLELTPGMRAAIVAQVRLLLAWNAHVNLTAIRTEGGVALEHAADSLCAVPYLLDRLAARLDPRSPVRLLDLGSGGGYPGVPVAVALPAAEAALVDSVAKKAAFLDAVAAVARDAFEEAGEEPPGLRAVNARAEDLARTDEHRGRWGIVTARGVAPLPRLVALALPLVRPGGMFVAWKRDGGDGALAAEIEASLPLVEELGGYPDVHVEPAAVAGLEDHRLVIVTRRTSASRSTLGPGGRLPPRRPASRRDRPLLP